MAEHTGSVSDREGGGSAHPALIEAQEWVLQAARDKAASAHHRLPQFYLRGFAGANGRLRMIDLSTGLETAAVPKAAFADEGYYTVRDYDNEPIALAEVLYESFEDKAARIHRRLLSGESPARLDARERSDYAFFLAAQVTRGETFREFDRELANAYKNVLRLQASHIEDWWPEFQRKMKDRGEELPPVSPEQFREFVGRDEYDIVHSPEMTMQLSISSLPDLARIFITFGWHTMHFEEPLLFTSEEPLSYWRPPSLGDRFHGIGPITSNEIRLPMSPTCALVLTHPRFGFSDRVGSGGRQAASWINFATFTFQPKRTLVMCPDVDHHPLPTIELLSGFVGGPVIDR